MKLTLEKGVLSVEYHEGRGRKRALKYRLARRAKEVLQVIRTYKGNEIRSLCDVGTADGMMLDTLNQNLSVKTAVGLDWSLELLKTNQNPELNLLR